MLAQIDGYREVGDDPVFVFVDEDVTWLQVLVSDVFILQHPHDSDQLCELGSKLVRRERSLLVLPDFDESLKIVVAARQESPDLQRLFEEF